MCAGTHITLWTLWRTNCVRYHEIRFKFVGMPSKNAVYLPSYDITWSWVLPPVGALFRKPPYASYARQMIVWSLIKTTPWYLNKQVYPLSGGWTAGKQLLTGLPGKNRSNFSWLYFFRHDLLGNKTERVEQRWVHCDKGLSWWPTMRWRNDPR